MPFIYTRKERSVLNSPESALLAFTRALTDIGYQFDVAPDGEQINFRLELSESLGTHVSLQFREQDCVQDLFTSLVFPSDQVLNGLAFINMIQRTLAHTSLFLTPEGRLAIRSSLYTDPIPGLSILRTFLLEPVLLLMRIAPGCEMIIEGKSAAEAVEALSAVERTGQLN